MVKRIIDTSKTLPKIVDTSKALPKVDAALVAKALGAEYIGNVGPNHHNLPLPKPVQGRLTQGNTTSDDKEKGAEVE